MPDRISVARPWWPPIAQSLTFLASLLPVLFSGAPPALAEARFTPGPCWFTVPEGEAALCGTVAVPDRRDRPSAGSFQLPVAVLLSTARQPAADPVLFIEGGPGASPFGTGEAVEERMEVWWDLSAPFRRTRNVILFDPRGVGRAEPDTDCPELDALGSRMPAAPASSEERVQQERTAVLACAARFKGKGLDGASFSTPIAADDALDVATALGASRVNLFAVSYGTRVALEMLRRHGGRVRAAVLDSAYPPDVNAVEEAPWLAQRAFRRLFDDCAANRACRAAYPDLEKRWLALLARLERSPVDLPVTDHDESEVPETLRLTPATMIAAGLEAMTSGEAVPQLPAMLDRATRGRYGPLAEWVPNPWAGDPDTADGLAFAIECRETVNPSDPLRLAETARRFAPYGAVATDDPGQRICRLWPAGHQEPGSGCRWRARCRCSCCPVPTTR
ncbi:alpha/beta fold hydrolase [Azospirillum thermophilum]|uniref:alpha/beta fold hydrolase n=1 Tax=Azospirillum thermophilum TaxID=2202148 RepID=UPI001FE6BDFE|nr:alpha/beta fold hydrolase [Azospirillum thermophilum]